MLVGFLWDASKGATVQLRSVPGIWSSGFGSANLSEHINLTFMQPTLISVVLLANTTQVISSILYLMYNGIFTCMLSAREWSLLKKPTTLRVSQPMGQQRRTYWLSLRYRYSNPLMVASTLLHWLISHAYHGL